MKDALLDLIAHISAIGDKEPIIKVTGNETRTEFFYVLDKQGGIVSGTFDNPIVDFVGVFGIRNLSLWKGVLSLKGFENDAAISVVKNKENEPISVQIANTAGHPISTLRLMTKTRVEEEVKTVVFKGANWAYECPEIDDASVETLGKFMSVFRETEKENNGCFLMEFSSANGQIIAHIGDQTTHSAEFRLFDGQGETITKKTYAANNIFAILKTSGTKKLRLSNQGMMEITVSSMFATYRYLLPANMK